MSTITKSPRKVLKVAYQAAQSILPLYTHRFSSQTFTLPQLFACLGLKTFLKTDYRGVTALLLDPALHIQTLLADAGYDSEPNHRYAREDRNIRTVIPSQHGRPSHQLPQGPYRRLMAQTLDTEPYGQRWQVETIFSMIKRRFGDVIHARSYWAQDREMMLMVLTNNLAVFLLVYELFLTRLFQRPVVDITK